MMTRVMVSLDLLSTFAHPSFYFLLLLFRDYEHKTSFVSIFSVQYWIMQFQ